MCVCVCLGTQAHRCCCRDQRSPLDVFFYHSWTYLKTVSVPENSSYHISYTDRPVRSSNPVLFLPPQYWGLSHVVSMTGFFHTGVVSLNWRLQAYTAIILPTELPPQQRNSLLDSHNELGINRCLPIVNSSIETQIRICKTFVTQLNFPKSTS